MKRFWQSFGKQILLDSLKVFIIVALIVLASAIAGWILITGYYTFYLAAFFFLFIPVWLLAFGIVFQAKWPWYTMALGSSVAIFMLSFLFFAVDESLWFRFLNSGLFAFIGTGLIIWGWLTAKVGTSIYQDYKKRKQKKKQGKTPPASLGI